ncbi:hypothetical protein [Citreicella sp. C3M06]|uniref:hypothetical protein n=1 Tax=Citreicella sp. C3M06 TaxID=2841564 RepID=UPI002090EB37|nr:hypothetical protein [Citreicella sp. C3M06]
MSLVTEQPVVDAIAHQLGASVSLAVVTILLSRLIGTPLGVLTRLRPGGMLDRELLVTSTGIKADPQFLVALVRSVVLAAQLRWLAGHRPRAGACDFHARCADGARHSVVLARGFVSVNAAIDLAVRRLDPGVAA